MAHELAHVVQQAGGAGFVQRQEDSEQAREFSQAGETDPAEALAEAAAQGVESRAERIASDIQRELDSRQRRTEFSARQVASAVRSAARLTAHDIYWEVYSEGDRVMADAEIMRLPARERWAEDRVSLSTIPFAWNSASLSGGDLGVETHIPAAPGRRALIQPYLPIELRFRYVDREALQGVVSLATGLELHVALELAVNVRLMAGLAGGRINPTEDESQWIGGPTLGGSVGIEGLRRGTRFDLRYDRTFHRAPPWNRLI